MGEHTNPWWVTFGSNVPEFPEGLVQDPNHEASPGPTRILLIESDQANAQLIRELLDEDGNYEVRSVTTSTDALQALGLNPDGEVREPSWSANLILFDLTLLADDEQNALRRTLESRRNWPPMIILSGWPAPYVETILARVNARGVIAKPFDVDTLLESVHQVLRSQRTQEAG